LVKIQIDKNAKTVSFKCNSEKEMKWVLEVYQKGNEKVREEAEAIFKSPVNMELSPHGEKKQ
jgi:hypothetical protein